MKTNTVEMTKGVDTIYAPKEQENYFKERGYSAVAPGTAAPTAADHKLKETTR